MLALRSARRWANELVPYKLLYSNRLLQTVVQRDPRYAQLTPEDVQHFRQLLGDADVITDAEKLEPFNA